MQVHLKPKICVNAGIYYMLVCKVLVLKIKKFFYSSTNKNKQNEIKLPFSNC